MTTIFASLCLFSQFHLYLAQQETSAAPILLTYFITLLEIGFVVSCYLLFISVQVKYGNTFRRVCVDDNNQIDLNMAGLRAKICSVFNFTANANFILSYVDEDGEKVDLVDDNDLNDMMKQQLKSLRIDVHGSGFFPLKLSQWRNTINKSSPGMILSKDAFWYGSLFVSWIGLCSIIYCKPKEQILQPVQHVSKGLFFVFGNSESGPKVHTSGGSNSSK